MDFTSPEFFVGDPSSQNLTQSYITTSPFLLLSVLQILYPMVASWREAISLMLTTFQYFMYQYMVVSKD